MTQLKRNIVKTILYFDIFSFPLTMEEISRYCCVPTTKEELKKALSELIKREQIHCLEGYYSIAKNIELVKERKERFEYSNRAMKTARRNARLINKFPFVRGVAISGSLSKFSANEAADIDFFIIAARERLWICRSFLHLFKKNHLPKGKPTQLLYELFPG